MTPRCMPVGIRLALLALLAWLWLASPQMTHADIIRKEGPLTRDETWTTGNIYVIGTFVDVAAGVTLVIQPGVIVKFNTNARLLVHGTLKLRGTADNPVYLTSLKDDAAGGDTNGDGVATAPAAGDWGAVIFIADYPETQSTIEYAIVRYGGHFRDDQANDYWSPLRCESASPTIRYSRIGQNRGSAISASVDSFPVTVGNIATDNDRNGLEIRGGTLTVSGQWGNTDLVYIVSSYVVVNPGVTLTIGPGVTVKFADNEWLGVYGTLRIQGTATQRVILTSLKDDAVGGDSNGDSDATLPASGDWASIILFAGGPSADDLIEYATIRYGGHYNSTDPGVLILNSVSPTIRHVSLTANRHGLVAWGMSYPMVISSAIYRNDYFGLYNGSRSSVVTAQDNWWGAASGPRDPSFDCNDPTHLYNPAGQGDTVSDYVVYEPWAARPPAVASLVVANTVFVSDTHGLPHLSILSGTAIGVAVPVECRPQKLTASLAGRNVLLADAGDGLWTGVISKTVTTKRTYELTATATGGTCDPLVTSVALVTLLPPSGHVTDAETGQPIVGATLTVYRYDAAQGGFRLWNGYAFGQVNSQITDSNGRFAWDLPRGRYYIVAQKAGYRDVQTEPFDVPPALADLTITMSRWPHRLALPIIMNQQPQSSTAPAAACRMGMSDDVGPASAAWP